jgi:hypothetical protein
VSYLLAIGEQILRLPAKQRSNRLYRSKSQMQNTWTHIRTSENKLPEFVDLQFLQRRKKGPYTNRFFFFFFFFFRNSMFGSHLVKSDFSLRVQKSIITQRSATKSTMCVFYTTERSHTSHMNDPTFRYSSGPGHKN